MTAHRPAELRQLDALAEFECTREAALTVACCHCTQPPAEPCVYPDGRPHPAPAHWQRIRDAERAASTDPEEDS